MKQAFILAILLLFICQTTYADTARILIVRHGEKTPKHLSSEQDLYPDVIGVLRSWALVPFFDQFAPSIDAIYAAPQDKKQHSFRPMEICANLASQRGISINALEGNNLIYVNQAANLAKNIRSNIKAGQTALVCWKHGSIPDIAAALGVDPKPVWSKTDFSSIWELEISDKRTTFKKTTEKLPNQFQIPVSAFSQVPISVLKTSYSLQYQQLLNFCPLSKTDATVHACQIDWEKQVSCCDALLHGKSPKGCKVTLQQCTTWYGI